MRLRSLQQALRLPPESFSTSGVQRTQHGRSHSISQPLDDAQSPSRAILPCSSSASSSSSGTRPDWIDFSVTSRALISCLVVLRLYLVMHPSSLIHWLSFLFLVIDIFHTQGTDWHQCLPFTFVTQPRRRPLQRHSHHWCSHPFGVPCWEGGNNPSHHP